MERATGRWKPSSIAGVALVAVVGVAAQATLVCVANRPTPVERPAGQAIDWQPPIQRPPIQQPPIQQPPPVAPVSPKPRAVVSKPEAVIAAPADSAWSEETAMPRVAAELGAAVYAGHIYVGGGYDGSKSSTDVYVANIGPDGHLGAWSATTPFPEKRCENALVAAHGYLYVVGGYRCGGEAYNDVQYAPIHDDGTLGEWKMTSRFAAPRYAMGVVAGDGYLYVLGGCTVPDQTDDVQYAAIHDDGTLGEWQTTSKLHGARSHLGVAVSGKRIYIAGGSGDDRFETENHHSYGSRHLDDVQVADIQPDGSLGDWKPAGHLDMPAVGGALVATRTQLFLLGGNGPTSYLDAAQTAMLDDNGDIGEWSEAPRFRYGRMTAAAVASGDRIYLLGGDTSEVRYLNDVQSLRVSTAERPGCILIDKLD